MFDVKLEIEPSFNYHYKIFDVDFDMEFDFSWNSSLIIELIWILN